MTANALRSGLFLLFFLAVCISAQAQNQSSDAHLSGTLLDSSAAVGRSKRHRTISKGRVAHGRSFIQSAAKECCALFQQYLDHRSVST